MDLSPTASRFDSSISWLAAIGNTVALDVFDDFGLDAVQTRNRELEGTLRAALTRAGWHPLELPEANRSTIVSIPLGGLDPARLVRVLADDGVVCSARDGALRLSVHLYNHEDDIERLVTVLATQERPGG
jgi:selenocysteine lyase/cysteine desulfurase